MKSDDSGERRARLVQCARETETWGVALAAYSHWPEGWHEIVVSILQSAKQLCVERLYIKEKLGSLRVQGGGFRLAELAEQTYARSLVTCAACGLNTEGATEPHLPLCKSCKANINPLTEIGWIRPGN